MTDRRRVRTRKRGTYFRYYIITASILTLLIALAFFTPQIIFQVQDMILCKDTSLSRQENVNVESLSTTYEKSLETRMTDYAEGLAGDDAFYVASQNLSINEELSAYFYSDSCIYGDFMSALIYARLLPYDLWEMEYAVSQWKQYVIYSDNFTKGVNFILWYIELQDSAGRTFKLLADAEDGTIYAVKTEGNPVFQEPELMNESYEQRYFMDEFGSSAVEMWGFCALYYAAIDETEVKNFYILAEELSWEDVSMISGSAMVDKEREMVLNALNISEDRRELLEKIQFYTKDKDTEVFRLPYGSFSLEMVMKLPTMVGAPMDAETYSNITIGIREIYEMIPEFA